MKKCFYFVLVLLSTSLLFGQDFDRIIGLTKEVKILNLLNGFELTTEQKKVIKKSIKEVQIIEKDFETQVEECLEIFDVALEKSIEILGTGKELPPSLKKEISTYSHEFKEGRKVKEGRILDIAQQIERVLEPQQVQQLKEFIPCLIPPPGRIRIGQTGSSEMIAKHLEKIRDLPESIYVREKDNIISKALKKKKEHLPVLKEFDEDAEGERIEAILDKVRSMRDVDFTLNKDRIAEEFKGDDKKRDSKNDVVQKIRHFLLDPIVLKYL